MFDIADNVLELYLCEMCILHKMLSISTGAVADMFWLAPKSRASPASHTHFCKRGKGLVKCVYKLSPATLHSVVQSHYSILSHDTTSPFE